MASLLKRSSVCIPSEPGLLLGKLNKRFQTPGCWKQLTGIIEFIGRPTGGHVTQMDSIEYALGTFAEVGRENSEWKY